MIGITAKTKIFEDINGKIWIVTRTGSNVEVQGRRDARERLYEIAVSCALKLGVTRTKKGLPIDSVKEHRRIWNAIWKKSGRALP